MTETSGLDPSGATWSELWAARLPLGRVGLFALAFLAMFLPILGIEAALGGLSELFAGESSAEVMGHLRYSAVMSTLVGYILCSFATLHPDAERDARDLRDLLSEAAALQPGALRARAARSTRGRSRAVVGTALIGIAVIPATVGDPLLLFRSEVWDARFVWSVAANALFFGMLGRLAHLSMVLESAFDCEVTAKLRVDLLDLEPLSSYARRGLRNSAYWFIGSSIASLLFLSLGFSIAVALVILGTLFAGVFALIQPARGLHRKLQREKCAELARLREAIRAARNGALERAGASDDAYRLPGLLAYEARIAAVSAWPFDVSTVLRFMIFFALPLGSWLGGALVERALGWALD